MLDQYQRNITYLRLSVTDLCNLRCRYCMPEDGTCRKRHEDMLTEEEMIAAVKAAASLGVQKLRITGGEPLVKKNILSICRNLSGISGIEEVCLTTNGTLLPSLARPLREAGVSRINISLDTLNPDKYAKMTRIGNLDDALNGLSAALFAGFDRIKINCVLIGGFNDDEITELAALTNDYPVDVRFIELMPMYDSGDFGPQSYVPASIVPEKLPELVPQEATDGVSRLYRFPDACGNIGLISPLSCDFCTDCNRIRLTADGKIKPCLHSHDEYNIKGLSQEEMRLQLEKAIMAKPARHPHLSYENRSESGRNMNQIGG